MFVRLSLRILASLQLRSLRVHPGIKFIASPTFGVFLEGEGAALRFCGSLGFDFGQPCSLLNLLLSLDIAFLFFAFGDLCSNEFLFSFLSFVLGLDNHNRDGQCDDEQGKFP